VSGDQLYREMLDGAPFFESAVCAQKMRGWPPVLLFYMGVAACAEAIARGHGPTLQKLEEIREALDRIAKCVQAQPREDS
jgi:hypothetical protein